MASGGHEQNPDADYHGECLDARGWGSNPEAEQAEQCQEDILKVRRAPLVSLEITETVPSVERGLEGGDVLLTGSHP